MYENYICGKKNVVFVKNMQILLSLILTLSLLLICSKVAAATSGDNILISEVGYHNTGNDPGAEWIELFNPTAAPIDISGWAITDGEGTVTIPFTTVIASGTYFIATHTTTTFNSLYPGVTVDLEYGPIDVGSIGLANTGDSVLLLDGVGNPVDFVSWEGDTSGWNIVAEAGETILRSTISDTDVEADWLSNQVPTPGSGDLIALSPTPNAIPTLSEWSLMLLAFLMGVVLYRENKLVIKKVRS